MGLVHYEKKGEKAKSRGLLAILQAKPNVFLPESIHPWSQGVKMASLPREDERESRSEKGFRNPKIDLGFLLVQCTVCKNASDQYENMIDLTVEIHGDAASLEECLDQFTAIEWLKEITCTNVIGVMTM